MTSPFSGSGIGGRSLSARQERAAASAAPPAPSAAQPGSVAALWQSATESPEQREIAGAIYARLKAGAQVDDVTDLIGRLRQSVTRRARVVGQGGQ
ncbi:hypothetical protein [Streptacidiphilus sp. EB129]|uniref:hypothetical protein n=1 Tax=Streptacidiphilus sp. EB129 TaxID=3156262 RepID=UPI003519A8ED